MKDEPEYHIGCDCVDCARQRRESVEVPSIPESGNAQAPDDNEKS